MVFRSWDIKEGNEKEQSNVVWILNLLLPPPPDRFLPCYYDAEQRRVDFKFIVATTAFFLAIMVQWDEIFIIDVQKQDMLESYQPVIA